MSQLATFDRRPWLILCEGESDKRFLHQLIETRALPNDFQVKFPGRGANDKRGGRSKFGPWLMTASAATGWSNIRGVLIVSDKDNDATVSFNEVLASLKAANWPGIPNAPDQIAKAANFPHTIIHMLPESQPHGGLEDLCLTAAYSKWTSIQAPLDAYALATGIAAWGATKQSKMRLASLVAATCKPRPDTGFIGHWWEDADYHVPVDHSAFDDIADLLRRLPLMVAMA